MLRHPVTTTISTASSNFAVSRPKKRGNYNCGRCGLPKKGHVCPFTPGPGGGGGGGGGDGSDDSVPIPPRSDPKLRRALSFDDEEVDETMSASPWTHLRSVKEEIEDDPWYDNDRDQKDDNGGLPIGCLIEILRRLPPKELMRAAAVCKGWSEAVRRVWRASEELRLCVDGRRKSPMGFVGSLLHRCSALTCLTLKMESDVDATVLACVAFSCPNLKAFEVKTADSSINRMTGDELGRFVAEKRHLSSLKIEGCSNLGHLNLFSSSLSTLWFSDLLCISKMVINCPNLKELSLDFSRQENDSTDVASLMESLGRTCPKLRNLHVASFRLSNEAVLALAGANLRSLRMLSLILGSKVTDASVAAIVSGFVDLELLDLSGSSISDNGIGMICNAFSRSLSRLFLAVCPIITSSGIQFATAQLPFLQIIDCGMSIADADNLDGGLLFRFEGSGELQRCRKRLSRNYQKLIIKHDRLRKISLWGCSGLDALYLNCPELSELNLNSCKNLDPEKLLLQCPALENVHVFGCQELLIGAINNQVFHKSSALENHFMCKRLADGSKRIQAPQSILANELYEPERKKARET